MWTTIVLVSTGELATANVQNTQVLGNLNELRTGGIAIASQAAEDLILASSTTQLKRLGKTNLATLVTNGSGVASWLAGVASQFLRLNAGGTAFEFAAVSSGASLIAEYSGTDTTAAATNVATVALSGLTVKDSLFVFIEHSSNAQSTARPVLYDATDSLTLMSLGQGADLPASGFAREVLHIMTDQGNSVYKFALLQTVQTVNDTQLGATVNGKLTSTGSTDWTSAWNMALRTGTGGVTTGGTYRYRIVVYKISGQ